MAAIREVPLYDMTYGSPDVVRITVQTGATRARLLSVGSKRESSPVAIVLVGGKPAREGAGKEIELVCVRHYARADIEVPDDVPEREYLNSVNDKNGQLWHVFGASTKPQSADAPEKQSAGPETKARATPPRA